MRVKSIIGGLASFIPGAYSHLSERKTGGTDSAQYCYEIWMKHLVFLWHNGMNEIPVTVAELGPGDSMGAGLAALLSGAGRYYAFDVVDYSKPDLNISIFEDLVELFRMRAGKPKESWPEYSEYLDSNLFPSHILTDELLGASLAGDRIEAIRNAILDPISKNGNKIISYITPWNDPHIIEGESIDMIFSHAVLEHVTALEETYRAMRLWLKRGGFISHQIDFRSHGLTREWNGYWTAGDLLWRLTCGRRPYLINRQPRSRHLELLEENGFDIICQFESETENSITRSQLAPRWKNLSEDDLKCSGMFVQARKN